MSAKAKLNEARKRFHESELKKTGHNKFAGYYYFELADFLVPALTIFHDLELSGIVSFGADVATMEITDLEDESSVVKITSPMSSAQLKACHEVQNLGAVETYLRRYLWVAALEIVEHDAIDSSEGADAAKPSKGKNNAPAKSKPKTAKDIAADITDRVIKRDGSKNAAAYLVSLEQAERDAIWVFLAPEIQDELTAVWPE